MEKKKPEPPSARERAVQVDMFSGPQKSSSPSIQGLERSRGSCQGDQLRDSASSSSSGHCHLRGRAVPSLEAQGAEDGQEGPSAATGERPPAGPFQGLDLTLTSVDTNGAHRSLKRQDPQTTKNRQTCEKGRPWKARPYNIRSRAWKGRAQTDLEKPRIAKMHCQHLHKIRQGFEASKQAQAGTRKRELEVWEEQPGFLTSGHVWGGSTLTTGGFPPSSPWPAIIHASLRCAPPDLETGCSRHLLHVHTRSRANAEKRSPFHAGVFCAFPLLTYPAPSFSQKPPQSRC